MANLLNQHAANNIAVPRVPVVERTTGLYWRDDNVQATKIIKMQGAIESGTPGSGVGAGQIFPTNQDR